MIYIDRYIDKWHNDMGIGLFSGLLYDIIRSADKKILFSAGVKSKNSGDAGDSPVFSSPKDSLVFVQCDKLAEWVMVNQSLTGRLLKKGYNAINEIF